MAAGKRGRPRHSFEDSAVESDFKFWGYHKGKQLAADGSSPENTIKRLLQGSIPPGAHKVLVLDMPPSAWDINARIMRLPEALRAALIARYCVPPRERGGYVTYYDPDELAAILGVSRREYHSRLRHARRRYKSMIFSLAE